MTDKPSLPNRLASIDAYRGLVLFLMMGEVLHFCAVSAARPVNAVWSFLCFNQSHVEWIGGSLHDLIQPGFSFLVGVALPFSLAARVAKGQNPAQHSASVRCTCRQLARSNRLRFLTVTDYRSAPNWLPP